MLDIIKNRLFICCILFVVFGILIMSSGMKDNASMAKGMTDFNDMTEGDFIAGRFVRGTIYELYDEFAYEEEYQRTFGIRHNERVSAHYYVMPLYATFDTDHPQYIAVRIANEEAADTAQKMIDEYWDYWETGEEPAKWTELPITGKIQKLDGEVLDYFYEWMMYGEESTNRADFDQYIVPYVISYYNPSGGSTGIIAGVIFLLIGILGAAAMIIYYMHKRQSRTSAPATALPSGGYVPTNSGSYTPTAGYTPVGSTSDGDNMEELMRQMNSISQPVDNADDFFNSPLPPEPDAKPVQQQDEKPAQPKNSYSADYGSMDAIDTSGLGIGIDDEN